MSVDIRDARAHFKQKEVEAEQAKPKSNGLLKQVEVAQETGDPHLDKMLRVIAQMIEQVDKTGQDFANQAMRMANPDAIRAKQMEFMATQGALKVLMELASVPAKIIEESRSSLVQ